jgi:uncharacterized membrane protein HdeD (DUF308 family)
MVDLRPERRGLRLGLGIAMVVLGVVALGSTPVVGVLSAVLLALALLTAGGVALISLFGSESVAETLIMLILAGMLLFTGVALLVDPVRAQVALTTLLGTYLLLSGVARIVIALFNRRGRWGGAILHGVVSLFLGVLIFAQWPLSGLVAVGLVVAIELIIVGVSWIVGAPTTRDGRPAHRSRRRRSANASRHG